MVVAYGVIDSKEGKSVRAIGLPVVEYLGKRQEEAEGRHRAGGLTAHVLRHSFASIANDLGFTEVTIAALVEHSKGK